MPTLQRVPSFFLLKRAQSGPGQALAPGFVQRLQWNAPDDAREGRPVTSRALRKRQGPKNFGCG